MQKQIFIQSYTKKDGTVVKAHYRNIDGAINNVEPFEGNIDDIVFDDYEMHGPMPQKKGNVPPEGGENVEKSESKGGFDVGGVMSKVLDIAITAASFVQLYYKAMQQNNSDMAKLMQHKLDDSISYIQSEQKRSEDMAKSYLKRLAETKNNTEYQNLLKSFARQKSINERLSHKISKIEYAKENNNYPALIDELQNFESDFDEIMTKTRKTRPLKRLYEIQNPSITLYNLSTIPKPYISTYTPKINSNPLLNKMLLDLGAPVYRFAKNAPEAKEFWKASSNDFYYSKKYINENGNLIYSVKDLPDEELRDIVIKKLEKQLNLSDALGVIFKSYSNISNAISQSSELKKFFLENKEKLLNSRNAEGSTTFNSTLNLNKAINNADILYAYIDHKTLNFKVVVLDTYDFNPGESWFIELARNVQNQELLRNYYTLILVEVPYAVWRLWLFIEICKEKLLI